MPTPTFRIGQADGIEEHAVNIQLWGFKNCSMVTAEGVAQALSLLPVHLLEGLKNINYEPIPLVPGITRWIKVPGRTGLLGHYDRKSSSILLYARESRRELFRTLFHELGHFAYFRIISSAEKKQWVTKLYKAEAPVTRYGARNAAEDFAEAFSLYLMEPDSMRSSPNKLNYLRNVVFRGSAVDQSALGEIVARQRENDVASRLDRYV
jgi:hypothetical protein